MYSSCAHAFVEGEIRYRHGVHLPKSGCPFRNSECKICCCSRTRVRTLAFSLSQSRTYHERAHYPCKMVSLRSLYRPTQAPAPSSTTSTTIVVRILVLCGHVVGSVNRSRKEVEEA